MKIYLIAIITAFCLISNNALCKSKKVDADYLINNVEKYINKKVEIVGKVAHICGVDGLKMKIKTAASSEIKVITGKNLPKIDFSFYDKNVRIIGRVKEIRLDEAYVDKMEKEQALLCSIDKSPCKDSAWVKKQWENGKAKESSKQGTSKLRERIRNSKNGYISIVTIVADKIELAE